MFTVFFKPKNIWTWWVKAFNIVLRIHIVLHLTEHKWKFGPKHIVAVQPVPTPHRQGDVKCLVASVTDDWTTYNIWQMPVTWSIVLYIATAPGSTWSTSLPRASLSEILWLNKLVGLSTIDFGGAWYQRFFQSKVLIRERLLANTESCSSVESLPRSGIFQLGHSYKMFNDITSWTSYRPFI